MGRWMEKIKKAQGDTPPKPPKTHIDESKDSLGGLRGVVGGAFPEKKELPPSIPELIDMIGEQCPLLHEDKLHIERGLLAIPIKWQLQLVEKYITTWKEASTDEPGEVKKENTGRRAANLIITRMLANRSKGNA